MGKVEDKPFIINQEKLNEAIEFFNNQQISSDEIKKQWDFRWWHGFESASQLVREVIEGLDWTLAYTTQEVIEHIEREIDLYKKDK